MATWNDVQIGDWVRGKDGALWAVADRQKTGLVSATFTMRRKGQADFSASVDLSAKAPEIVRTADEMVESAVQVAADVLGGQVLHSENDGIYACPPEYAEPGALLAHLHILHEQRFDPASGTSTLALLTALHAQLHKDGGHTPHQHTPDYLKANRDA